MVKRLLKSIFPVVFLKRASLLVNTIKIKTFDKILFPAYKPLPQEIVLNTEDTPFKDFDINTLSDTSVRKLMKAWRVWKDQEYIINATDGIIEPENGWLIQKGHYLNYFSIGIKSRRYFLQRPSLLTIIKKKNTLALKECISLRDPGEENYFHFYNDVISKLIFLQIKGYDLKKYYIIISSKVWEKPYFKFFLQNSPLLKSLRWHVQKDEFIKAEHVILSKPITHSKEILGEFITWSGVENKPALRERKVFITRSKSRLRFIENEEEIQAVCNELGFEMVDADAISLPEQISLFRETRWLVGIHGAGLMNIIYRKGLPMNMLELFPPPELNYLPFHYIMLAKMYGFNYNAIIGEKAKKKFSGGFYINPLALKEHMIRLLT